MVLHSRTWKRTLAALCCKTPRAKNHALCSALKLRCQRFLLWAQQSGPRLVHYVITWVSAGHARTLSANTVAGTE